MKTQHRCLECRQWIPIGESKCSCGWKLPHAEMMMPLSYDCQYQNNGKHCKLQGTMSHSTHGGGKWYCSYHYHSLGDPKKAEEALDYIEQHREEMNINRIDWRRKLYPQNK